VTFGCGKGFGEKFSDGDGSDAGPGGEEIFLYGLSPGGDRRAEARPV
jgi:hypothetical protein